MDLTGVPMLHNLGLAMAYHLSSGPNMPGFLWCAELDLCRSFGGVTDLFFLVFCLFAVLAIMTTVETALPNSSFVGSTHLIMPWVSLSVGLNIIVTSMICFRLLRMRALIKDALSPEMTRVYTSIAAILIESAAPFTIIGIGVVVTQARKSTVAFAFSYVWGAFCVESFRSPFPSTGRRT